MYRWASWSKKQQPEVIWREWLWSWEGRTPALCLLTVTVSKLALYFSLFSTVYILLTFIPFICFIFPSTHIEFVLIITFNDLSFLTILFDAVTRQMSPLWDKYRIMLASIWNGTINTSIVFWSFQYGSTIWPVMLISFSPKCYWEWTHSFFSGNMRGLSGLVHNLW